MTRLLTPIEAGPEWLSVPKAADMLGISAKTMGRLLDAGKIAFTRPRHHRRVSVTSVLHYRERQLRGRQRRQSYDLADDPLRD